MQHVHICNLKLISFFSHYHEQGGEARLNVLVIDVVLCGPIKREIQR